MIKIGTVLCPIDFSAASERALKLAVSVADRFGSRLVLQHNAEARSPGARIWSDGHVGEESPEAQDAAVRLREVLATIPASIDSEAKITRGPLEGSVLEAAKHLAADLLVLGTHSRADASHHSLTERLISRAPCTVLTVGEACEVEEFDRIVARKGRVVVVVPADFKPGTEDVLVFIEAIAEQLPHEVHLLHVLGRDVEDPDGAALDARARLLALAPPDLRERLFVEVRFGRPADEIVAIAQEAHAIFLLMGAHRKGLLARHLLGDKAVEILHRSPCPVWFVPVRGASYRKDHKQVRAAYR